MSTIVVQLILGEFVINNVPEGVADFIEGRASATVGSMHYLSKAKQADFWYSNVVDELSHVIIG